MRSYGTKALSRRPLHRRGYALVLVLIFIVLFLALLGLVWRQLTSVLLVATARTAQIQRDEGGLGALAAAMQLLETGRPPTSPCVYSKTVTLSSGEPRYYLVTYERDTTPPAQDASPPEKWSVKATRVGEASTPVLPTSFSP